MAKKKRLTKKKPTIYNITSKNIIVAAKNLNPTVLTADWLNSNTKIKDFKTEVLIPPLTIAKSSKLQLVCEPQKLQVLMGNQLNGTLSDAQAAVTSITKELSNISFIALGVNFQGCLSFDTEKQLFQFIRKYISVGTIKGFCDDNDKSVKIAPALIKDDILKSRLTIKMTPIIDTQNSKNILIIDFNFHNNINDSCKINLLLKDSSKKEQYSDNILQEFKNAKRSI